MKLFISDDKIQKIYDQTRIGEWSEWSLFEWLCLIYHVKKGVIIAIKVIEIFVTTDEPKEAEQLIKKMNLDVFKKKAVQQIIPE